MGPTRSTSTTGSTDKAQPGRAIVGVLPDGTVFYVPRGELRRSRGGTCCHLCGFWYPFLGRHVRDDHGWPSSRYARAFGVRVAPESDRPRPPRATPGRRPGGRTRCRELEHTMQETLGRLHMAGIGDYVLPGVAAGWSLAELSRRAGLGDRWLDLHLADVAPDVALEARRLRDGDGGARTVAMRWLSRLESLGYADPLDYLCDRRGAGWSWSRIAQESGVTDNWLQRRRAALVAPAR